MTEKLEQYLGTGRRKTSTARVYLRPGKGRLMVNGEDWKKYFGDRPTLDHMMRAPLRDTQTLTKYDVIVNVLGGGPTGQAGAIRHGIARALVEANPAHRFALKKAGYLTRDSRAVERKKPGLHKARRASQFSKR
ncbi:30S ribosomal protein S9 [Candidatus Poribacteria bacterium]|nr:30S ribosomal protein S9 [Candidatus Poribacteria bacterium]